MKKIVLSIDGMTCAACSNGLEKYLNKQKGIDNAVVNLVLSTATIIYDEKIINQKEIENCIEESGFRSLGEFKEIKKETQQRKEKINLIIFTILAILLIYISMGHMIHFPQIPFLTLPDHIKNYMICLLILTLPFLWYGRDILKNGYKNLIHKTPNMDTLVSIGVLTSFLYSIYEFIQAFLQNSMNGIHLYFESSAIIIYFVKLGRYIDHMSQNKTKSAITDLVQITPSKAAIKIQENLKEVTIDEIKKGDIIVAKAGEKIAVDGIITYGSTHLDESFITGESKPVSKEKGDKIIAGSINYDGYIEYEAQKIGKESTISEIVRLVVEATNTKVPIARVADKVASYFVPTILIIALLAFLLNIIIGNPLGDALITLVTVLVAACPCSLGLATPLAIIVSEGYCATNGILIKKSEVLETASKIDTVVFDKTGTLTYGTLKIAEIKNYSDLNQKEMMKIACSLEKMSTHPIAKAFDQYRQEESFVSYEVKDFINIPGYGISGKINKETILLGNSKMLEKYKIKNLYQKDEEKLLNNQNSIIYVVKNKKIIALIGVNDIIRKEAKDVIKMLQKRKIETIMLTGDAKQTAEHVAKKLGITKVISNVVPSTKSKVIEDLKKQQKKVMMCGDGINDSPALTMADIGVSVSSGTDIALDSSLVILTGNDLKSIVKLIDISTRTMKNIKENLFWAFFYNAIMIPIACGLFKNFGITINPMLASLAMVLSSLTVVFNTLRLKKTDRM